MIMNGLISALRRAGLDDSLLSAWNERRRPLVLITGHRRENFGVGFTNICMGYPPFSGEISICGFCLSNASESQCT